MIIQARIGPVAAVAPHDPCAGHAIVGIPPESNIVRTPTLLKSFAGGTRRWYHSVRR
jgi:hypothetical protein